MIQYSFFGAPRLAKQGPGGRVAVLLLLLALEVAGDLVGGVIPERFCGLFEP